MLTPVPAPSEHRSAAAAREAPAPLLLAVYAPLDSLRGALPDELTASADRRLVAHLRRVARCGVNVAALIDAADGETQFVRIAGGANAEPAVVACGKMRMNHPATLTRFLVDAHAAFPPVSPGAATVLALEGRGGGFVPEIDLRERAASPGEPGAPRWVQGAGWWMPVREDGSALIERGAPIGIRRSPNVPLAGLPLSTPALGRALADAVALGMPRLAVLLLDGSFDMSVEVLHTVMPYAEQAVGYPNHNFFSAGATFPLALCGLQAAGPALNGPAAAEAIADRLVMANHALLGRDGAHPTVGCAIRLARMHRIVECIDDLADAMLAALRAPQGRPAATEGIRRAVVQAQQYDTEASVDPQGSVDEQVDIASFAAALATGGGFGPASVAQAARALQDALVSVKRYGDSGVPWFLPEMRWDFSYTPHAMNIFMPDPTLDGLWDWRSPDYLDVVETPTGRVTAFQQQTDWVDFIIEYHREVPFRGLRPAVLPPVLHHREAAFRSAPA